MGTLGALLVLVNPILASAYTFNEVLLLLETGWIRFKPSNRGNYNNYFCNPIWVRVLPRATFLSFFIVPKVTRSELPGKDYADDILHSKNLFAKINELNAILSHSGFYLFTEGIPVDYFGFLRNYTSVFYNLTIIYRF